MNYENKTATYAWMEMLKSLHRDGSGSTPRNKPTLELVGCRTSFDMNYPIVSTKRRKLNYQFMAAEALWILEGKDDVETIAKFAKRYADFSDDGKTLYGAYGPRVMSQIEHIVDTLLTDNNSRQAVMTTWIPNPKESKDIPCTVSSQFIIRYDRLHLLQTMRSSDAWLGWPYDMFSFTMVALYIALILRQAGLQKLQLGTMIMTAGSQHIYEENWQRVVECITNPHSHRYEGLKIEEFDGQTPATLLLHLEHIRDRTLVPGKINFMKEVLTWQKI